jgi:hypothetical protein
MNNLIYDLFGKGECRYKEKCPNAPIPNGLCASDKEARSYYNASTPVGCYRRMAQREEELKSRKKRINIGKFLEFISN